MIGPITKEQYIEQIEKALKDMWDNYAIRDPRAERLYRAAERAIARSMNA